MSHDSALPDFDSKWNYGDPAATEQAFRQIESETHSTADNGYRAQLLTQIARAQGLQRQFDDAHKTLDQVDAMLTDSMPSNAADEVRVRYLLERGRVFNSSGDKDSAKPLFNEAWELARVQPSLAFYAVDAAHMLGIAEEPDAALQWNEKAIAHAEQSDSDKAKKWLGSLYNNTGWTHHEKGNFDRAMELFKNALAWFEAHGNDGQISVAHWAVARCHRSLGQFDEALSIQRDLETKMEAVAAPDGYVYEELGELLWSKQERDAARPYFRKAYDELSKDDWLKANESSRLTRLKALADG